MLAKRTVDARLYRPSFWRTTSLVRCEVGKGVYIAHIHFEIEHVSYIICAKLNSNGRFECGVGNVIMIWEVYEPVDSMQAEFVV